MTMYMSFRYETIYFPVVWNGSDDYVIVIIFCNWDQLLNSTSEMPENKGIGLTTCFEVTIGLTLLSILLHSPNEKKKKIGWHFSCFRQVVLFFMLLFRLQSTSYLKIGGIFSFMIWQVGNIMIVWVLWF